MWYHSTLCRWCLRIFTSLIKDGMCSTTRAKENHPSIHFLYKLILCDGRVTLWTSHQLIAEPHSITITPAAILEPLNSLHAYLWNVKVREREEELKLCEPWDQLPWPREGSHVASFHKPWWRACIFGGGCTVWSIQKRNHETESYLVVLQTGLTFQRLSTRAEICGPAAKMQI